MSRIVVEPFSHYSAREITLPFTVIKGRYNSRPGELLPGAPTPELDRLDQDIKRLGAQFLVAEDNKLTIFFATNVRDHRAHQHEMLPRVVAAIVAVYPALKGAEVAYELTDRERAEQAYQQFLAKVQRVAEWDPNRSAITVHNDDQARRVYTLIHAAQGVNLGPISNGVCFAAVWDIVLPSSLPARPHKIYLEYPEARWQVKFRPGYRDGDWYPVGNAHFESEQAARDSRLYQDFSRYERQVRIVPLLF